MKLPYRPSIAVIDNYPRDSTTDRIHRIKGLVQELSLETELEIIRYDELRTRGLSRDTKAMILSGSSLNVSDLRQPSTYDPKANTSDFVHEIGLIKEATRPILAICFGHHLVAGCFGIPVNRCRQSSEKKKIKEILMRPGDELIGGWCSVDVWHKDFVSAYDVRTSGVFDVHATTVDNDHVYVQYMRHRYLPIFSIQFHPETHDSLPGGYEEVGNSSFDQAKTEGRGLIHRFIRLSLHRTNTNVLSKRTFWGQAY